MNNLEYCTSKLFGNIEKNAEKNNNIMVLMETIDDKTIEYNLKELDEKQIKEDAIAMYNRITKL